MPKPIKGGLTHKKLGEFIQLVVDYNWVDECNDYIDQEEGRDAHIFVALVALNNYLHGTDEKADDYLASVQVGAGLTPHNPLDDMSDDELTEYHLRGGK